MLEERWKASGRQKNSEEVNKEATLKEEQADNGNAQVEPTVDVEATEEKEDQSSSAEVEKKKDDNS